ncbi:hypothetical protein BU24DRAFT_435432 [Aaosphaeria arxii CBS 175.79]|uniref:VOC domain-containing protein n=1 Tax=Aaosphaeria arxii CBS 175.79 TaxID=1450172 RepID=A0A6A5XFW0_9PLEO|nr:uncharacterized protein BU24DRAFT_435432 [Aaosphaeria arxii CBS 175.79]KAF2011972.1 hypothetical protein BU24DRAFT_435432 [Aaosphaeria arxii CBS 175.79]
MTHQRIRVVRLAHVYYQHPNLQTALDFLGDFGFIEQARDGVGKVYLRGYGEQPYIYVAEQSPDDSRHFLGAAWAVETRSDLDIAAGVDSATPIRKNDGPGGGEIVSIKDPNGMFVHFVHGQELRQPVTGSSLPVLEKTVSVSNTVTRKDRKGDFRRFTPGPSPIHKLGHYGYGVPRNNFKLTLNWYLKTLNLKETDSVFNPITGDDETCFLHIDLGDQFTDHHSFFVAATDAPHAFVHHSSYEVNDFDTETLGHDWLLKKGWKNCWGLGRHVLGSQIFDYW